MSNTTTHTNSEQEILNESFDAASQILEVENIGGGGVSATAIAASVATDTVIKASAGRLARVVVTTTGTNPMQIFDNATAGSGKIIGSLPASPAIGSVYDFEMPAANGITVKGNAANPAVTISWI